ncbi:MAG TPA: hypothetical protein VHU83_12700 [Bryobacteraceae bacterium]|jgi:hypothetical protein|nr:hypothetical protein [Bryobacteraceae bacterium]
MATLVYEVLTAPYFGVLFNLISLGGFFLAWRSWQDSRKQETRMEGLLDKVNRVASSLTTKQIGEFPAYLGMIREVVEKARREIVVISAIPGFGSFSSPQEWELLAAALKNQQYSGRTVTLVTGSAATRTEDFRVQFSLAKQDWESWWKDPSNREKLNLVTTRYSVPRVDVPTQSWFEEMLAGAVQTKILSDTYFKADICFTDTFMPLMAWIVDRSSAIFAVNNGQGTPPGFYTEDKNIVDALLRLAERYQRIASKSRTNAASNW